MVGTPLVLGSPQSIAFGQGALWVADHAGWLVKIDPATFTVVARQRLDFGAHGVVVTDAAVYVADAHGNVSAVAFGFRSLWAALQTGQVVRITPKPSA